jgi:N-formylglutamate amidohydrolase
VSPAQAAAFPLAALAIIWLAAGVGAAQTSELVFIQAGTIPIILTAPHGGNAPVPGVPERSRGTLTQDARTRELTEEISQRLETVLCERPYVVMAHFHRRYIDANRPEADAYEHPDARSHYVAYHESIRRFVNEIRERYPEGAILIDVHGQSEDPGRIHRGTRNGRTVARLIARHGDDAVAGGNSIFGQLRTAGYEIFPTSASLRDSREDRRWDGGHTVGSYGSHNPDGIDAIQIEIGRDFRQDNTSGRFVAHLADAVVTFYRTYLGGQTRCS